jgi:tetratricopeptide (TPR) repeat protein
LIAVAAPEREALAVDVQRAAPSAQSLPRAYLLAAVLCAVAVGVSYATSLKGSFVWDDVPLIQQDERLRSFASLGDIFERDFFERSDDSVKYGYYRPLVTVSYLVDRSLYGLEPRSFHLTNLALHYGCTLLVYGLGVVAFALPQAAALGGALLFAVHPVHTESVAWISGRTDVLATAFMLAALLLHVVAQQAHRRRVVWRALSLAAFFMALLSKELAFAAPLLIAARELGHKRPREILRDVAPYLAVAVSYLVLRFVVLGVSTNSPADVSLASYLATLPTAFFRYLGELVFPLPLSAYLQHPWVKQPSLSALASAAGALALAWLAFRGFQGGARVPVVLGISVVAALVPVSNLVSISGPPDMGFVMAERFLYLPSVYFCLAIGLAAVALSRLPGARVPVATAAVFVLGGGAYATAQRGHDYRDDGTFMRSALVHAPDAYLLNARLAAFESLQGKHASAIELFERAIVLRKRESGREDAMLQADLGRALHRAGRDEEALAVLEPVIDSLASARVLGTYGEALTALGRTDDAERALHRARALSDRTADPYLGLARVALARGDLAAAKEHHAAALELAPDNPALYVLGGDFARMQRDHAGAERAYRRALELDPRAAPAHAALGALAAEAGDVARARELLGRALELDAALADAELALAVLDARAGELDAARARLEALLEREHDHADARLMLARVHARRGSLSEARSEAERVAREHAGDARVAQAAEQFARALRAHGEVTPPK